MTLSSIQQGIAAILQADPYLLQAQAEAIYENDGDLDAKIRTALAKLGLMVLVLTPACRRNGAGSYIDATVTVVIQVAEHPVINRARAGHVTALDMAEHIAAYLDNHPIPPAAQPLSFSSIDPIDVAKSLAYNVRYQTRAILQAGTPL